MDKIKILVVDDESRMRKLVKDFLEREGYQVIEAGDGMEAMEQFYDEKDIALIILDVMMPRMDGWQVCREVRQSSKVPIIMLTARSEERDELQGFQLGVDEYISKPFSPKELMARIAAVLRRTKGSLEHNDVLQFGKLCIEPKSRTITLDSLPLRLPPKEFDLLLKLAQNQRIVLSREKLLETVWGYSYYGDNRTVDTHIKSLREHLGPYRKLVQTVWGVGYRFEYVDEN